jgi:hypothetical protein
MCWMLPGIEARPCKGASGWTQSLMHSIAVMMSPTRVMNMTEIDQEQHTESSVWRQSSILPDLSSWKFVAQAEMKTLPTRDQSRG